MHKICAPNSVPPFRPRIVSSIGTYNYNLAKFSRCSLLEPHTLSDKNMPLTSYLLFTRSVVYLC